MNVMELATAAGTILSEKLGAHWHIRGRIDPLHDRVGVHIYDIDPTKATDIIDELSNLAGGTKVLARGVGHDAGTFTLYVNAS